MTSYVACSTDLDRSGRAPVRVQGPFAKQGHAPETGHRMMAPWITERQVGQVPEQQAGRPWSEEPL